MSHEENSLLREQSDAAAFVAKPLRELLEHVVAAPDGEKPRDAESCDPPQVPQLGVFFG
jgi:hypothetical protein